MSEKVSQRYRLWHDKLVQAVRVAMPPHAPYTVVHAQNLVGLFTCIFVKNAEMLNLRDVAITTVKRGMAGMYGNKVRPTGMGSTGLVCLAALTQSSLFSLAGSYHRPLCHR